MEWLPITEDGDIPISFLVLLSLQTLLSQACAVSQAWTMLEHVVAGLPLFDRCSDHVCKCCCIYHDDSKGGDRGEEGGSLASLPTSWP